MIPILAAAPSCLADDPEAAAGRGRINLWQQAQQPPPRGAGENPNPMGASVSSFSYLGKPMAVPMFDPAASAFAAAPPSGVLGGSFASVGGGFVTAGVGGSSAPTCQDCGNQAKKDCVHRRCRTCCKSRGFDCATHVRSTWVPAARRRERQMSAAPAGAVSSASTSTAKKARLIGAGNADAPPPGAVNTTASRTSTSNTTTPPRSFETSSSHQDASFREIRLPGEVRAPAVFKCVRVTTVDDGEDEFAYQAMVRIGGHVFKGFLYDQGLDATPGITAAGGGGREADNRGSMPNISDLHLGGAGAGGGGGPSDVYAGAPGSTGHGLTGGTTYGNPLN